MSPMGQLLAGYLLLVVSMLAWAAAAFWACVAIPTAVAALLRGLLWLERVAREGWPFPTEDDE